MEQISPQWCVLRTRYLLVQKLSNWFVPNVSLPLICFWFLIDIICMLLFTLICSFHSILLQSSFKANCTICFDSSSICWCFMLCIILQFFTWSLFSFNSSDYLIIGTKLSLYFISISFNKETEKRVNDKYCKIRSYYVVWWYILHYNKSKLSMFHQV